jgi:hypothetical protein
MCDHSLCNKTMKSACLGTGRLDRICVRILSSSGEIFNAVSTPGAPAENQQQGLARAALCRMTQI